MNVSGKIPVTIIFHSNVYFLLWFYPMALAASFFFSWQDMMTTRNLFLCLSIILIIQYVDYKELFSFLVHHSNYPICGPTGA
uniref:Uncharacterized protein n=1 Tax=Rhizophora mucronata TaxID=61149 RepID=A0A2P2QL31_RHIMU